MTDMITISKKEYAILKKSQLMLEMLEGGGVDNWFGYGDALNPDDDQSYDELSKEIDNQVLNGEKQ